MLRSVTAAFRSSAFVAAFTSIFQGLYCTHSSFSNALPFDAPLRKFLAKQGFQRNYLFISGFLCSFISIYMENKRRRAELALYVFPKALESFYRVLLARKIITKSIPAGVEILAGMVAFAVIMGWYDQHPECLSPMLKVMLTKIVGPSEAAAVIIQKKSYEGEGVAVSSISMDNKDSKELDGNVEVERTSTTAVC